MLAVPSPSTLAVSYSDWNLALGMFVAAATLAFAVLGVFLVRRIVQEDRARRALDDRLSEQAEDTRVVRDRLGKAPWARLSALADRLRRAGVLVGDAAVHAGRTPEGPPGYLAAEAGFAPFDPPARIKAELADGKTLEVRPADPRVVADAKREYVTVLRVLHDLYHAAFHVGRRNTRLIEEVEALHHRIRTLKRSLVGAAVAFAALVALPLGLVVAVPTRPLRFYLIDVTITLFAARMLLLVLFVVGTVITTWMLWRALSRIDLGGLRHDLVASHRDPRAFHERLAVPDARRSARLEAVTDPTPVHPVAPPARSRAPAPTPRSPA